MTEAAQKVDLEPFENLDRAALVSMRMRGLPPAMAPQLYAAVRKSGEPLSYRCATALAAPDLRKVAILTGIVAGPLLRGETDGPIGASVLAGALGDIGVAADVIVPTEMVAVVEAVRDSLHGSFGVVDEAHARPDGYDAGVAIEKLGRNRRGVYHWIFGGNLENYSSAADDFIEAIARSGKLTVGVGDGGNEIGFGAVFDEIREFVPAGAKCKCPCGDGLVTSTATRLVLAASVSNFGAYSMVAALGVLKGLPLLLPSPERIAGALEAAVVRGCVDGGTMEAGRLMDDSVPLDAVKALVTLYRTIAAQPFTATPRRA